MQLSWASPAGGDDEAVADSSTSFDRVQSAPRIVLMGSRRSGKTSMERVVFGKISPHETLFLPATNTPTLRLVSNSDLARFALFDIPGALDLADLQMDGSELTPFTIFSRCVALVYVIDAETEPYVECARFAQFVATARQVNPRIALEVFVHKVDGDLFLTDEQKFDCRREIEACIRAELNDLSINRIGRASERQNLSSNDFRANKTKNVLDSMFSDQVSFSLTSIYDHSIFEAFSKVISKRLVPQRDALEKMLDALVAACDMDKSFLFDVSSRVYIATDSAPVDSASYELCADAIDVVLDVGGVYSHTNHNTILSDDESTILNSPRAPVPENKTFDTASSAEIIDASINMMSSSAVQNDLPPPSTNNISSAESSSKQNVATAASVTLSNGISLVFDQVDTSLAIVCLIRTDNLDKPLINYNLMCFRNALRKLSQVAQTCNSSSK
mmetsp:Transcript_20354/g.26385  ORF Transcript_20354/g.26385 Transcript_20354/m.26385 type:complete len:445 (+) Transcript_20354:42-1376(+)